MPMEDFFEIFSEDVDFSKFEKKNEPDDDDNF